MSRGSSVAVGTFYFPRVCVYIISTHMLNPRSLKITEATPLLKLAAPILGQMAGETTNPTCTGSHLD